MLWLWFLLGVVFSGPLWLAVIWYARRIRAGRLHPDRRANESLAELSQIVGGLAHEIKNPLSTINLNLELLSEDIRRHDDEEHRRLTRRLSIVQNEADRVRQILDDFLRYAGHYELSLSNVDLRDVVSELRDFFLPQAEASGAVLRTTECHDPLPCCLDVKLFKQAVLNLLLNATQAMPNGGELLVKISRNNELGCVEIIDTGAGIPPEQLETIFQPYWSTKKGGSGLGLPTARRILREHGGTMKVESDVGKGTRFVLSVPLRKTPTKKG